MYGPHILNDLRTPLPWGKALENTESYEEETAPFEQSSDVAHKCVLQLCFSSPKTWTPWSPLVLHSLCNLPLDLQRPTGAREACYFFPAN